MLAAALQAARTITLSALLIGHLAGAALIQDEAGDHLSRGLGLIQRGRAEEALAELEKAIELSPDLADAHFYAGMALGQLRRFEESLAQFLAAAGLEPGNGQAHVMACRTAYTLRAYEEAWNQGILAAQAGEDMSEAFAELDAVSPRPADFESRMTVPLVYVAELDLSRVAVGGAAPGTMTGSSITIARALADFAQARRQLGLSLVRSKRFAVTQRRGRAAYVLLVELDDTESLAGLAKLIDTRTGEVAAMRPFSLPSAIGALRYEADRLIGFFETQIEKR